MPASRGSGRPCWARSWRGRVACLVVMWPANRVLGVVFDRFNRGFTATANGYARFVGGHCSDGSSSLVLRGLRRSLLGLTVLVASRGTPRGFIPSQDMGYLLVNIQLPDSAALERTQA